MSPNPKHQPPPPHPGWMRCRSTPGYPLAVFCHFHRRAKVFTFRKQQKVKIRLKFLIEMVQRAIHSTATTFLGKPVQKDRLCNQYVQSRANYRYTPPRLSHPSPSQKKKKPNVDHMGSEFRAAIVKEQCIWRNGVYEQVLYFHGTQKHYHRSKCHGQTTAKRSGFSDKTSLI